MGELEIFAIRIKQLRESKQMTQKEFSEHIGIKQQTLSGYERGLMKPPLDVAKIIAEKCNISIDWLCGLSEREAISEEFLTYGDILTTLFELDNNIEIVLLKQKISDYCTMTGIFFEDDTLGEFLEEWLDATNVKDNTTINKTITQAMYDSWKKAKFEELRNKKLKKSKRKKT